MTLGEKRKAEGEADEDGDEGEESDEGFEDDEEADGEQFPITHEIVLKDHTKVCPAPNSPSALSHGRDLREGRQQKTGTATLAK